MFEIEKTDECMTESAEALSEAVVGRRIVSVEKVELSSGIHSWSKVLTTVLTLDNGSRVELYEESDCCAYTEIEKFLLSPERVDHIITGVGTTDDYSTWHIYADMGDVLELTVGWSEGSGYYAYGLDIRVVPTDN